MYSSFPLLLSYRIFIMPHLFIFREIERQATVSYDMNQPQLYHFRRIFFQRKAFIKQHIVRLTTRRIEG